MSQTRKNSRLSPPPSNLLLPILYFFQTRTWIPTFQLRRRTRRTRCLGAVTGCEFFRGRRTRLRGSGSAGSAEDRRVGNRWDPGRFLFRTHGRDRTHRAIRGILQAHQSSRRRQERFMVEAGKSGQQRGPSSLRRRYLPSARRITRAV